MRWIRIALFTLAGIVSLLVVAVGILVSIDLGRFKVEIEEYVSDLLGRELRIEGVLHANVGNSIEVYAENVYLLNPEWADEENFVAVRKLDVVIDFWALLDKTVIFERAEIDGADVNLERNAAGDSSWRFQGLINRSKDKPPPPGNAQKERRFPLLFGDIYITNSSVSFLNEGWDRPLQLDARNIRSSEPDSDQLLIELDGALNDTPMKLRKRIWPVQNLARYQDVNVEVNGNVGEITIVSSAWLDNMLAPHRPRLELVIDGPNAEYLAQVLEVRQITTGPMSLEFSLQPDQESIDIEVDATYGEFDVELEGLLSGLRNFTRADLQLAAHGPDVGTILRFFDRTYDDVDAFEIEASVRKDGKQLDIEDVTVEIGESLLTAAGQFPDFPGPRGGNLLVNAKGPDFGRFNRLFGMPGRLGGDFVASLELAPQADGSTLARLDATAPHARIKLQSLISASESFTDTTLLMDISGPDIAVITDAMGIAGVQREPFEINGTIEKDADGYLVQNVIALVGDDRLRLDGRLGDRPLSGKTDLNVEFIGSDLGASIVALGGSASRLPTGGYSFEGRVQFREDELRLDDVRGYIGDARDYEFKLSGMIDDGVNFAGSELEISARGTSIAALADLFRIGGIPEYSFDVAANVRRGVSNTYIRNGMFEVGDTRATFEGHIGDQPLTDDLQFNLFTDTADLHDTLEAFGLPLDNIPAGQITTSVAMRREGGDLVLQDLQISMETVTLAAKGNIGEPPKLDGSSIDFTIAGDDLAALLPEEYSVENLAHRFQVSGALQVSAENLTLTGIQASLDQSVLQVDGNLSLEPLLYRGEFSFDGNSPDLYKFLPELQNFAVTRAAPMTLRGAVNWDGGYWQFDEVALSIGEGRLNVDGSIDRPPSLHRTDLTIDWQAASIRKLSRLVGRELPDQAVTLTGRLIGSDNVVSMEDFSLQLGPSDLRGQFQYIDREVPHIALDLHSRVLDLSEFSKAPEEVPPEPAETQASDRRVIPDAPLPLAALRALTMDFNAEIQELRSGSLRASDLVMDGKLQDGAVVIERFVGTGQRGGTLRADARLVPDGSGRADFSLAADGDALVLGFITKSQDELQQLPTFEVDLEIHGSGASVHDIASSSNGFFRMVGSSGRIRAGAFSMFTQDVIAQLLSALNPFQKTDPYTNVECVAVLAKFEDGKVSGSPLLVQKSDKLLILGRADIDLETEKLDVGFQTIPQKGLGIGLTSLVNPYIRLGGTLGAPSLELNPERVLVEGGLAVATAGISVLAKTVRDRFLTNQHPCEDAIADADEEFGFDAD